MTRRPSCQLVVDYANPRAEVTISIPPGWFTNISAISRKAYPQLMSIKSSVGGGTPLERKFVSQSNIVMIDTIKTTATTTTTTPTRKPKTENQSRAFPIKPHDKAIDVVLAFYYSEKRVEDSNLKQIVEIEDKAYASTKVVVHEVSDSTSDDIPDNHTVFVCVENGQEGDGVAEHDDLVATISLIKMSVAGPPPRPSKLEEYFKLYETAFLLDDSASMKSHGRWTSLKDALSAFSGLAISHDAVGISISFLNSDVKFGLKRDHDKHKVTEALSMVGPHGQCTPTGKRVAEYMRDFLAKLDRAAQNGYSQIKPLDLVCFTDGCPNDEDPEFDLVKVLLDMSAHFRERKYPAEWMSIKFVQIGADADARDALVKLTYLSTGGMVQAFPYDKSGSGISAEKIKSILLAQ